MKPRVDTSQAEASFPWCASSFTTCEKMCDFQKKPIWNILHQMWGKLFESYSTFEHLIKAQVFGTFISLYIFFWWSTSWSKNLFMCWPKAFLKTSSLCLCARGNLYTEWIMTFSCVIFYIMKENTALCMYFMFVAPLGTTRVIRHSSTEKQVMETN